MPVHFDPWRADQVLKTLLSVDLIAVVPIPVRCICNLMLIIIYTCFIAFDIYARTGVGEEPF